MQRVWSTYLGSPAHRRSQSSHMMDSSSPRASIASRANSAYSNAGSTRHILSDMNDHDAFLEPPSVPFAGSASLPRTPIKASASNVSLSVNYQPTKFSPIVPPGGIRKRKGGEDVEPVIPKQGGGVDVFRAGEARMPGGKFMRWTRFKWILFITNLFLTGYSLVAIVFCLLIWFNVWEHADVVRVGNRPELIISTIAASIGLMTSVIGWAGILLNDRSFLATYTFLTWITFAFLVAPGYITYKRRTFNLEGKINAQWSRDLGSDGRLRIQDQLLCCGYFSPFVEATVSQTCYARSILPGCKLRYLNFQRMVLSRWFMIAFILVPVHISVMVAGLLCSNHVTYRFGKGMMPEAYRLNMNSMAVIMDSYANQLADQYGPDMAEDVLKRSRSNLHLETLPVAPYNRAQKRAQAPYHAKYDSLAGG